MKERNIIDVNREGEKLSTIEEIANFSYREIIQYFLNYIAETNDFLNTQNLFLKLRNKFSNKGDRASFEMVDIFARFFELRSIKKGINKYQLNKIRNKMKYKQELYFNYYKQFYPVEVQSSIENIFGLSSYLVGDKENGDFLMENLMKEHEDEDIKRKALSNKTMYDLIYPLSEASSSIIMSQYKKIDSSDREKYEELIYELGRSINRAEQNKFLISHYMKEILSLYEKISYETKKNTEDIITNLVESEEENLGNDREDVTLKVLIEKYDEVNAYGRNVINLYVLITLLILYAEKTLINIKKILFGNEGFEEQDKKIIERVKKMELGSILNYDSPENKYIVYLFYNLTGEKEEGVDSFLNSQEKKSIREALNYLKERQENFTEPGYIERFYIDDLVDKLSYLKNILK